MTGQRKRGLSVDLHVVRGLAAGLALGLGATFASVGRAEDTPTVTPSAPPSVSVESDSSLVTYSLPDTFRIQYPQSWRVDELTGDSIEIVSALGDPTLDIHTQVQLLRENPGDVVNRSIDQFVTDQVRVERYSRVTVDQQSGFRVWMGDYHHPKSQMVGDAIATFIGYDLGDGILQTAVLISQYPPNQPETAALILQIHDSFVNDTVVNNTVNNPL